MKSTNPEHADLEGERTTNYIAGHPRMQLNSTHIQTDQVN